MISLHQNGNYLHFYYNETCPNDPAAILAQVEDMFTKIAGLPKGNWYVRVRPEIERARIAWTDDIAVNVRCRISAEINTAVEDKIGSGPLGFPP